jgi:hypothetical protein
MRGLVVFLMVTAASAALASEGTPEVVEASAVPEASTAAAAVEPLTGTSEAATPPAAEEEEAAAPAPAGPRPKLRLVDLAVDLTKARYPARRADLYAPVGPPAVVAEGYGLLVQRRFGR